MNIQSLHTCICRFPTEASILESYKRKVTWNAYKAQVVQEVVRSRDLRSAPAYRGPSRKNPAAAPPRDADTSSLERSHTATRLLTASLNRSPRGAEKKKKKDKKPAKSAAVQAAGEDVKNDPKESRSEDVEARDGDPSHAVTTAPAETPAPVSPVAEVETHSKADPPTPPRPQPASDVVAELEARPPINPQTAPYAYGVGPAPTAVIVRRRSSLGVSHRPFVSAEVTFVARQRQSRDDTSPNHVTRFHLANDLDCASVAEES